MKATLIAMTLVGLCGLGVLEILGGNFRVGIASLLLSVANGLLLTQ